MLEKRPTSLKSACLEDILSDPDLEQYSRPPEAPTRVDEHGFMVPYTLARARTHTHTHTSDRLFVHVGHKGDIEIVCPICTLKFLTILSFFVSRTKR